MVVDSAKALAYQQVAEAFGEGRRGPVKGVCLQRKSETWLEQAFSVL